MRLSNMGGSNKTQHLQSMQGLIMASCCMQGPLHHEPVARGAVHC